MLFVVILTIWKWGHTVKISLREYRAGMQQCWSSDLPSFNSSGWKIPQDVLMDVANHSPKYQTVRLKRLKQQRGTEVKPFDIAATSKQRLHKNHVLKPAAKCELYAFTGLFWNLVHVCIGPEVFFSTNDEFQSTPHPPPQKNVNASNVSSTTTKYL